MLVKPLPRYVVTRPLADGQIGFYFTVPKKYRKLGCAVPNEPLGTDYVIACGEDGKGGRAAAANGLFDEWMALRRGEELETVVRYGTVDWLFREYRKSDAYTKKVSKRSRPDYERTMLLVADTITKKGDRVGSRPISSIDPPATDKLYNRILNGPRGRRPRQAEKATALCRKAWRVVKRLHPSLFNKDVPNPWEGVTKENRTKGRKAAVTREQVYAFAWGCIEWGDAAIGAGAAAVICFEWLQRPENVLGGYLRWTDYRSEQFPSSIRIEHHKTGEMIWHPLEEETEEGTIQFYPEAEEILAHVPRLGIPMILYQPRARGDRPAPPAKPYAFSGVQKMVQKMRARLGLPATFTLDACRHGGMTELEEAELTDGQGRALSAHRTQQSYEGYAKRTMKRALGATRKRRAHVLANTQGTPVRNGGRNPVRNAAGKLKTASKPSG